MSDFADDGDDVARVIVDATFGGIRFPVSGFDSDYARSGKPHEVFARKGGDIEDTGEKPFQGSLTCEFLNGLQGFENVNLFPGELRRLVAKISKEPISDFTHPLHGRMKAWFFGVKIKSDSTVRNGVQVDIQWMEHNGTAQVIAGQSGQTPQDAKQTTTSQSEVADAAMEEVASGNYAPVTPVVESAMASIDSADENAATRPQTITAAVASITAVCDENLALSSLSTVEAAQSCLELERLKASALALRDSLLIGLRRANTITVPRTMSAPEIAQMAYGDATLYQGIIDANPVVAADPMLVAAGTTIIVPPGE